MLRFTIFFLFSLGQQMGLSQSVKNPMIKSSEVIDHWVIVSNLKCVVSLGVSGTHEDRAYLEYPLGISLNRVRPQIFALHQKAIGKQCDLEILDVLVRRGGMMFGQLPIEITVNQERATYPEMRGTRCRRLYRESLTLHLPLGVELETGYQQLYIDAQGCQTP